ncbi:hypothetical protein I549_2069 [Mycobacterium avium subsp. avium 2285 (R)]|uniref:Uncharacterized protein n=1 Tax=Mycobacterium avium (strain 104) TaxID=243243 RepID=A0A0H2ZT39_MYCA1|nr:hypothetical protein MAV_4020 [Mycobacterium avium 104]EUA38898.1 hypothetical protein I549_2069 [Mycobacterium avium subsp. avium 2285 (R)]
MQPPRDIGRFLAASTRSATVKRAGEFSGRAVVRVVDGF